jgi:hypothetical protein
MDKDRAFFRASAGRSRTRWWSSDASALGLFACVTGMLILAAWGLSKRPHWYEPTHINHEVGLYELVASGRLWRK